MNRKTLICIAVIIATVFPVCIYCFQIPFEYSGVAEPGIPLNRAMQIPEARARVSTIENHMKRVAICTDCR